MVLCVFNWNFLWNHRSIHTRHSTHGVCILQPLIDFRQCYGAQLLVYSVVSEWTQLLSWCMYANNTVGSSTCKVLPWQQHTAQVPKYNSEAKVSLMKQNTLHQLVTHLLRVWLQLRQGSVRLARGCETSTRVGVVGRGLGFFQPLHLQPSDWKQIFYLISVTFITTVRTQTNVICGAGFV